MFQTIKGVAKLQGCLGPLKFEFWFLWPKLKGCVVCLFISIIKEDEHLWQYGLWSFQTGGTKLERFLPKNQHTRRKLLNFEFWINGELSKSAKI